MSRTTKIELILLAGLLHTLTAGFGLFVPRILGLDNCGDYWGGRLLWILFLSLVLFIAALIAVATGHRRAARRFGEVMGVLIISAVVNTKLDQDPFAAWLNWKARTVEIHPDWGYSIENHEQIFLSEKHQVIYACGSMTQVPAELKDEFVWLSDYRFDDYPIE